MCAESIKSVLLCPWQTLAQWFTFITIHISWFASDIINYSNLLCTNYLRHISRHISKSPHSNSSKRHWYVQQIEQTVQMSQVCLYLYATCTKSCENEVSLTNFFSRHSLDFSVHKCQHITTVHDSLTWLTSMQTSISGIKRMIKHTKCLLRISP